MVFVVWAAQLSCVSVSVSAFRARTSQRTAAQMFQLLWDSLSCVKNTTGVRCYLRGNSPISCVSMGTVVEILCGASSLGSVFAALSLSVAAFFSWALFHSVSFVGSSLSWAPRGALRRKTTTLE